MHLQNSLVMKKAFALFFALLVCLTVSAQQIFTYEYAVKDTNHLKMDVYVPAQQNAEHSCMIFVCAGGFITGARKNKQIPDLQKYYTAKGWVVVSIDYRLGLKNYSNYSLVTGLKKFTNAIEMAGEDLIDATDYILKNLLSTPYFTIDPAHIVTIGSSAGAITTLEADYFLGNRIHGAELLPDTFRYAGVISFAGAAYTNKGKLRYRVHAPAPTLLCHGIKDKAVPYKRVRFFNLGFYGSYTVAKRFKEEGYPLYFRRYEGMGHEVATYYNTEFKLIDQFLEVMVFGKKMQQVDEWYNDPNLEKMFWSTLKAKDMKRLKTKLEAEIKAE